jgi:hypothetical protein
VYEIRVAQDLVTLRVGMGSYQKELCMSLVFCVSTHVKWCEIEIKISGEDIVCTG